MEEERDGFTECSDTARSSYVNDITSREVLLLIDSIYGALSLIPAKIRIEP
jgi:hypothetical protein